VRGADVVADVRDMAAMESALADCETVIHLAGAVAVDASWDDVYGTNIGGTYNVFESARRNGLRRIIFASSNHAVGMNEVEHAPLIYQPGFGRVIGVNDA